MFADQSAHLNEKIVCLLLPKQHEPNGALMLSILLLFLVQKVMIKYMLNEDRKSLLQLRQTLEHEQMVWGGVRLEH